MLRLRCRDTRCACVSALFAAALDWQQGTARGDGEREREGRVKLMLVGAMMTTEDDDDDDDA